MTIAYSINPLIQTVQQFFLQNANSVPGADVLVKRGINVDVVITATAKVIPGYSTVSVSAAASAAVAALFASQLAGMIDESGVVAAIQTTPGIQSVAVGTLTMALASNPGVSLPEISVSSYQYLNLSSLTVSAT